MCVCARVYFSIPRKFKHHKNDPKQGLIIQHPLHPRPLPAVLSPAKLDAVPFERQQEGERGRHCEEASMRGWKKRETLQALPVIRDFTPTRHKPFIPLL